MVEEKDNTKSTANNFPADESDEKDMTSKVETEITESVEEKLSICEDKLQRALADYQNLERRNSIEVSQKILQKTNQLMLGFVGIYEDFIRAKSALENESANIEGLEGIIKNMKSLRDENHIEPIETKGKIFDPKFHEAVSTVEDNSLDEGTITQEVAKGYISFQEVIKPSKVIVSKKVKGIMKDD